MLCSSLHAPHWPGHTTLRHLQATTHDPWPELPKALAAQVPSSKLKPGGCEEQRLTHARTCARACTHARAALAPAPSGVPHPDAPREPEALGEAARPEDLERELWARFESHRGARVRLEAEVARVSTCCAVLQEEIAALEAGLAAATDEGAAAMKKVGGGCARAWVGACWL